MLLISGGVALFLLGTAGLRASMGLPRPLVGVALAAVVMLLCPLGFVNAAVQLAAIAAVMAVVLAAEPRLFGPPGDPVRSPSARPSDPASGPPVKPSAPTSGPSVKPSGSPAA